MGTQSIADVTDYPLYIVTASADDEISGCLAGFVTQASIKPIRYVVCVSKVNHTFGVAERSDGLGLHLLGQDQHGLAALFGEESMDVVDKFAQVAWSRGETGAPILAECAAWVEGDVINRTSGGDHEVLLMTVRRGGPGTHAGQFMRSDAASFEAGHPA
jgi:flavin reductase (DIM6/NTAB) family NADH-FMN oxidoreductase RutF